MKKLFGTLLYTGVISMFGWAMFGLGSTYGEAKANEEFMKVLEADTKRLEDILQRMKES